MKYLIIALVLFVLISVFVFLGWVLINMPKLIEKQKKEDEQFVEKADAPVLEETKYGFGMLKWLCIVLSVAYLGFMVFWFTTNGSVPTIFPLVLFMISSVYLSKRVKRMNEELVNKKIEPVAGGDRPC